MIRLVTLLTFLIFGSNLEAQIAYRVGFQSMYIKGDIKPMREIVNGIELSANHSLKKLLYTDLAIGFSKLSGIDPQFWFGSELGGGLIGEEFVGLGANRLHPNYINNYTYVDFGTSIKPSISDGLLRFELGAGVGFSISQIKMDLRDANDEFYNATTNFSRIEDILSRMDGEYETKFKSGKTFLPHIYIQVGVAMDIADNVYISLNIKSQFANTDQLDTAGSGIYEVNDKDSVRSINLGFHYGLGDDSF